MENFNTKICPNCNSVVETDFELCWNCQYSFAEKKILSENDFEMHCPQCHSAMDPSFHTCTSCGFKVGYPNKPHTKAAHGTKKINCLRCDIPMRYIGDFDLREGNRVGLFGNLMELFINRESFDLYNCPQCGKIEFFLPDQV